MSSTSERPEILYRPLEEVQVEDILELMRTSLGEDSTRSEAFWAWKHHQNPFGSSPGIAALCEEQLVGLRVFLRWSFKQGKRVVRAVRPVDTATHPDWQRRGLFRQMTERLVERVAAEGVELAYNTPNAKSRPGYLRMGWKTVGRIPVQLRLARPLRVVAGYVRSGRAEDKATSDLQFLPKVDELLAESRLPGFLARLSQSKDRLHTERTVEYLRWRYQEAPGLDYRALWDLGDESGAVLIARSQTRRTLREVALSEVLLSDSGGGLRQGTDLLRQLTAKSDCDYLVACSSLGMKEAEALRKAGFLPPWKIGPWLTVRTLRTCAQQEPLDSWHSWHPSLGDLELF